jgi:hypothetical protein
MEMAEIKTGPGIDLTEDFSVYTPRGNFPCGVFAFAASPPLAKSRRGNFPAAI